MSKPTPVVAANWKSNGTVAGLEELAAVFAKAAKGPELVVAPSALHLALAKEKFAGTAFQVAAQNATAKAGAFTGEVNLDQLKDFGVEWVILGHSERRAMYNETDEVVAGKVDAALAKGLKVIACVGESLEQREAGTTEEVVLAQLFAIADKVPVAQWGQVVLAYEPVWAIGTGKVATPQQAQEVHKAIRTFLAKISVEVANETRVLYGGSVNAKNAQSLYEQPVCQGTECAHPPPTHRTSTASLSVVLP